MPGGAVAPSHADGPRAPHTAAPPPGALTPANAPLPPAAPAAGGPPLAASPWGTSGIRPPGAPPAAPAWGPPPIVAAGAPGGAAVPAPDPAAPQPGAPPALSAPVAHPAPAATQAVPLAGGPAPPSNATGAVAAGAQGAIQWKQEAERGGGRPPCVVAAFSFTGQMVRTRPGGVAQQFDIQDIVKSSFADWYTDLKEFPGPFGRVERDTTEKLAAHLRKLASRLVDQDASSHSLDSIARYPHSAALACEFLSCLMEADGKRQTDEFWQRFAPALAKRAVALRPVGAASPLQSHCAKLCSGDVPGALEDACKEGLWAHALALSRSVSPDAYDRVLTGFGAALAQPSTAAHASERPTELELGDPSVCALILLYEVLGQGNIPDIQDTALPSWPAYVALFAAVLRASEQRGLFYKFLEVLASGLARQGDIFGAHVCLLLTADRSLEPVDAPSSLVCLLGVEHRSPKNFRFLLEPVALQLSEAFEYAVRCGDADALCPTLQPFKLAHAMMLADIGLIEKARRYMTLLQAFVKAVPQNRLSDAFRSSMRELNEMLNPSLSAGPADAGPRVGKGLRDLFRGIAETTGLAVKPTPPPALGADDDDGAEAEQRPGVPLLAAAARPQTPSAVTPPLWQQQVCPAPDVGPASRPVPNVAGPGGPPLSVAAPMPAAMPAMPPTQAAPSAPTPSVPMPSPGSAPWAAGGGGTSWQPAAAVAPPTVHASGGGMWGPPPPLASTPQGALGEGLLGSCPPGGGDGPEGAAAAQAPQRMTDSFEQDPLLNAGKAVWSGVKGLFSTVRGGGTDGKDAPQRGEKDSKENTFYFDTEKKIWRQRGAADEPDASEYDPMTGKKLAPKVTEPPPPPPPSMSAGVPSPMGMSATSSLGAARRHSGSLYVNPLAPAATNPVGVSQTSPPAAGYPGGAPPQMWGPPPLGGGQGPPESGGPLASSFAAAGQAPFGGAAPLAPPPMGAPLQPGQGVRSSPFG